jgi:hypothetical protein
MRRSEFCQSRGLSFSTLDRHLKQRFADLQRALSEPNYAATVETIRAIKEIQREEYGKQMNQRAQFYRDHPKANPWDKKEELQGLGLKDYPEQ